MLLWILGRTQFEGERAGIAAELSNPVPCSIDREEATQTNDPYELAAAALSVRIGGSTGGSLSRMTLGEMAGSTKRTPGIRTWLQRARSGAERDAWTHARSYVGLSPTNFVHRARLNRLRSLLRQLDLSSRGLVIDLGCSDGFILSELRRNEDLPPTWRVAGYDCVPRLLQAARRRRLPRARFRRIDLNDAAARVTKPGDVVLCLETLEHVGDYRSALQVLHNAVNPGGRLILSMPNEVGLVGLVKFLTRPLLRRNAYEDFFSSYRQVLRYALAVATYRDLEPFRSPPRGGWGPHLGFDHRKVKRHIRCAFVDNGLWTTERVSRSAFGANHILVVRRTSDLELRRPASIDTEQFPGESPVSALAPVAALFSLAQVDLEALVREFPWSAVGS
jgi:2-polyprenyl-3-methyl-5-hydroxy-6-metoxy-1,4-benzoquinol methylase